MAIISVPSSIQGNSYSVRIAGDTPTPEEQAKIAAYVAQMDARLQPAAPQTAQDAGPDTSFSGALSTSIDQPLENIATTARALGGEGIASFFSGLTEPPANYQSATEGFINEGGTLFDFSYLPRAVVEQGGQFAGSLLSRAAGTALGAGLGGVTGGPAGAAAGAVAGGLAGPALFEAVQILGPVALERAKNNGREEPNSEDWLAAAGTSAGSGALNAIAPGLSGFFKKVVVEGGTEAVQSIIQQAGETAGTDVGLQVSPRQALAEGVLGGTAAGVISAPSAIMERGRKKAEEKAAGEKKILDEINEDQEEDAVDILDRIKFGEAAAAAPAGEPFIKPAGLLPSPTTEGKKEELITPPAPTSGGISSETEQRIMQVLQNAQKQRVAGKNQLVSKTGAKSLVEAGLLSEEDALVAPIANARVMELLDQGPDAIRQRIIDAIRRRIIAAPPVGTQPTTVQPPAPRKTMPFRWRQYTSALNAVAKSGDATIPSIQRAASPDPKRLISPAVAKGIRSQLVTDGVLAPNKKAKGGFSVKTQAIPQLGPAESYRRTLDDLDADITDANTAREKAIQDARRAEQTGTAADARKFTLQAAQAEERLAEAERTRAEVEARLATARRDTIVPTTEQPASLTAEGKAVTPITEAPEAVQDVAVQTRSERLKTAFDYYQGKASQRNAELKGLRETGKKVQLSNLQKQRVADLELEAEKESAIVAKLKQAMARPAEDVAEARVKAAAEATKAAAAAAAQAQRTPIYSEREGQLFSALRRRLSGLGLDDVRLVAERMISTKDQPEGSLVEGMMEVDPTSGNRVIAVAMGIYDPKMSDKELFDAISSVMDHEVIHALRSLGLFTDAEWKNLSDLAARQQYMKVKGGKVVQRNYTYLQRAKQMYAGDTAEVQVEEAVAEMFRDYVAGRLKIGGRPRTLMERIKGFFRSIWKSHEDAGITDPNTIFEGVRLGDIGRRARPAAAQRDVIKEGTLIDTLTRQSRVAAVRAPSDPDFRRWASGPNGERVIADADGNPKVYYTGTSKDQDFTKFKVDKHGGWFTTDPNEASNYAEENDSMGFRRDGWDMKRINTASRVMPVFLRAANPFTGPKPQSVLSQANYKKAQTEWFDSLRRQGYDAWTPSDTPSLAVMLKDPSQVKSVFARGADGKGDMRRYSRLIATDNPGGKWLENKQRNAEEDMQNARPGSYLGKGLGGSITAYMPKSVNLPVKNLAALSGAQDEDRRAGDPQYDALADDVSRRGFLPDQNGNAVVVGVNHLGQAYIIEGNTRVAVARDFGVPTIRAEVRWFNGGELADGPFTPAAVEQLVPQEPSDAGQNVGGAASGEAGNLEAGGRAAGQPTSPDIAPRTADGRTDVGGLTLDDLDTLSPEFFDKPGWAVLTATVQGRKDFVNERAHQNLKNDLEFMKIPYREVYGMYEGNPDGVSYIALMDEPTAVMLGNRYDQDSVLTNRGLVYARMPMPRNIREEGVAYGDEARAKEFYSQLDDGRAFSLELNFSSSGPAFADIGPGYYTLPDRPQLPIRASDGKVELHHWSGKKLKNVDPAKAGTGPLNGVERRRGAKLGFFGIMPRPDARAQGTGYVKESGLGDIEHVALVDPKSLYPYFTDPENLSEGLDPQSPYFQNEYEERIKSAGFKGYYTERIDTTTPLGKVRPFDAPLGNVAAMFEKTPVKPAQEVQLGLRNQTRYSVRKALTAPLTKAEQRLTVLDMMNPVTAQFIPDGNRRDVVQAIQELFNRRGGVVIMPDEPDAATKVARLMLAELRMALVRSPEAIGWYGTTLAKAKRVAAVLHPEISPVNPYSGAKSNSYDPDSEHAWDLAMAITSNGMAVSENAKFANQQYEHWKETGRFLEEGTGDQGSGMVAAFRAYNIMKENMTDAQISEFLSSKMTVKELRNNPIIKRLGIKVGTNEGVNTVVNGSYIFGPKIGQGFYQNLRGNFDPLTMDLWFMRMFNRLTGRPFKRPEESLLLKNAERVSSLANAEDISEYDQRVMKTAMESENIDIVTPENADRFAVAFDKIYQRDFKKFYDEAVKASGLPPKSSEAKAIGKAARPQGSDLVLAAKRYRENLSLVPQDSPRNASDRAYMRAVVDQVQNVLANEGRYISVADIQAVMWYAEKQLFAAMGVRQGKGGDNDYVDGAIELLRSRGIDDAEIARGLPAAERDRLRYRTASERTFARLRGESPSDDQVEGRGGVGGVSGETVRGRETPSPRDGDQGRGDRRLSIRLSVASPSLKTKRSIAANEKALMYARSSDVLAKALTLRGYGMEETRAREFMDGLLRRFQDSMLPIGRMIQDLSQRGLTITDAMDPYLKETLMHGIVGKRIAENQDGLYAPVASAIKRLNVPEARINQLVAASNAASADGPGYVGLALAQSQSPRLVLADAYLYARHAKERNRYIRENRDKENAIGSGMSDAEADAILKWFDALDVPNKQAVQDMAKGIRLIVADTNQTRVDGGLIGSDVEDPYKFYVPLRGITDEDVDTEEDSFRGPPSTPRFGAKGREDPKALGRYGYAADIVANVFTQNQNSILRAERNKVGQSLLQLLRADPTMTKDFAEILPSMPTKRGESGRKDATLVDRPDRSVYEDPYILVVKEDGKEKFVRFTDPRTAGAMNGSNSYSPLTSGFILRAMQQINRYLSSINTSYNPEFIITNMARDLQTAGVNINQFEMDGLTASAMGNLKSALKGIKRSIRDNDDSSEWSKIYKDFVAAGGQNATNQVNSLADEMDNISTILGDISESGLRGQWAKMKSSFVGQKAGSLLKLIEDYNTVVENGIRVATYKTLLDRGFTRERAAQAARNVTVNFAKGGDYRQFMNAMYLFYNASLQGTFALINAATRSSKVRKIWGSIIVAGFIMDQLAAAMSDDDDDEEKIYDKIPPHVLESNIVVMDPMGLTSRGYFTIPLPYGLHMAFNAGRSLSRASRGEYSAGQATQSILNNVLDTINPIGGSESFANFVFPTVADPFIDMLENEDYANKSIYKEALAFDRTPEPRSQMYWSTTSPSAIWVANNLNELTGGNQVRPGLIDISPDVIQFWVEFVTGGIGRFAMSIPEASIAAAQEGFTEDLVGQIPLARKLYRSVTEREDMSYYIEGAKAILTAGEELKRARETGDEQWMRETIQRYPKELRLVGPIKSIESGLRRISRMRNDVKDNPSMTDEQKRVIMDRLDEQKQMLLMRASKMLKDAGL